MDVILGSQSPRRKDILSYFSLPFVQKPSPFDEDRFVFDGPPEAFVEQLSKEKAKALSVENPTSVVICADTIVELDGERMGKPRDKDDALRMLRALSGSWHNVFTGVTVQQGDKVFTSHECTRVLLRTLNEQQLHRYIDAVHSFDKAGAWAIQGKGELIVERMEGSHSNVVGFPMTTLQNLLAKVGINLWEWL